MSPPSSLSRRQSPPTFQPRFVLSLIYLAVFFVFYCFALMVPELLEVLETVPVGPQQQKIAEEVAQAAIAPRLPVAAALSITTLGVLGYFQRLPGLRASS